MNDAFLLDECRSLRIIGIDPGTVHIGLSVSETTDKGLRVLDAYTVHTELLVRRHYENLAERMDDRYALIKAGVDAIMTYIRVWGGDMIAYESPYLGKHAQAFGSGVEIMTLVRESIIQESQFLPFYTLDPARVKTAVGVSGKSGDKDKVLKGIMKSPFLTFDISLTDLDEHAIDSIAVGLAVYRNRVKL